jgi:type II secretory pathway pseudopilin PulG
MLPLRSSRAGFTLLELAAALTLTVVLAALLCGLLIVQTGLARRVADRARTTDALRTAHFVLDAEARRMQRADVRDIAADSLAARSFRGSAIPCSTTDSARLHVRYRGDRLPDPRKDSLVVVTVAGERAAALVESTASPAIGCVAYAGEVILRWQAAAAIADAAVLLVFESGSYYLTSRALRYRVGAEGRQPITAEAFAHPLTRFGDIADDAITFRLHASGADSMAVRAPFARGGIQP